MQSFARNMLVALAGLAWAMPTWADEAAGMQEVKRLGGKVISRHVLDFANAQVTDADLKVLEQFKELAVLRLDGTGITDQGLKIVGARRKLRHLYLGNTAVTDAGIRELRNLKDLSILNLNKTQVTGAGLAALTGCKELQEVTLIGAAVTNDGLKGLKDLHAVELLVLSETRITDAGLANLKGMKKLHGLFFDSTRITDAGLHTFRDLRDFPNLDRLSAYKTQVTKAGADELKRATSGKIWMVWH